MAHRGFLPSLYPPARHSVRLEALQPHPRRIGGEDSLQQAPQPPPRRRRPRGGPGSRIPQPRPAQALGQRFPLRFVLAGREQPAVGAAVAAESWRGFRHLIALCGAPLRAYGVAQAAALYSPPAQSRTATAGGQVDDAPGRVLSFPRRLSTRSGPPRDGSDMPARSEWDAIVVGSGLGRLTTAAYLTNNGLRTLVLEKHYVAGGNAPVFRRKQAFGFDLGGHYLGECGPDRLI